MPLPSRGCKGTLLFARRRRRAVDSGRTVSEEGNEWCDGPAKTSSGGDTSEELDAAMGASARITGGCGRAANVAAMVMANYF